MEPSNVALVWVFMGCGGSNPSGVFRSIETAEKWIETNRLSGTLTAYPLDIGVYEWAKHNGHFIAKNDHQMTARFIGRFSSASLEHYHYSNGIRER